MTLALNLGSPEEVDAATEEARAAGAAIAHNPRWTLSDDGAVTLPPD